MAKGDKGKGQGKQGIKDQGSHATSVLHVGIDLILAILVCALGGLTRLLAGSPGWAF